MNVSKSTKTCGWAGEFGQGAKTPLPQPRRHEHSLLMEENRETVLNNAFWGYTSMDISETANSCHNGVFQWISEPKLTYIFEI
jgi:hypothetical protein